MKLRTLAEIVGAWAIFLAGIALMYWWDSKRYEEREQRAIGAAVMILGPPLYECRANRPWYGLDEWVAQNPDCDAMCVVERLQDQAGNIPIRKDSDMVSR